MTDKTSNHDENSKQDQGDDTLDAAFAQMRAAPPVISPDLMDRIKADAEHALPDPSHDAALRPGLWSQVLGALGGWPGAAGLVATACTGLWIGGAMPVDLIGVTYGADLAATDLEDTLGAFDALLVEG